MALRAHSSTGFTPALLFFNRSINSGLPEITQRIDNQLHNNVRVNDSNSQRIIADNFAKVYKPKKSDIEVGDQILLKQSKTNQLSSYYDPQPYIVKKKNGSTITVTNKSGSYTRDISHAKKLLAKHGNERDTAIKKDMDKDNEKRFKTEIKVYPKRDSKPTVRYK